MIAFITIIISFILGIIGVIAKTEKEDDSETDKKKKFSYIVDLSPVGYVVLALLTITFGLGLFVEYQNGIDAENALRDAKIKGKNDSTAQATTIELLKEQIHDDSARYLNTVSLINEELLGQKLTLGNTALQLTRQNKTLHEIQRGATLLDKVAFIVCSKYEFQYPEVKRFSDEIAVVGMRIAKERYKTEDGIHSEDKSHWRFNDEEYKMSVNAWIVSDSVTLDYIELGLDSRLLSYSSSNLFSMINMSLDISRQSSKKPQDHPNLKLQASNYTYLNNSFQPAEVNVNGIDPPRTGVEIDYGLRQVTQRVFCTHIKRSFDDGSITSVMDLKNASIMITRPNVDLNNSTLGEIIYMNMLWGDSFSRNFVFDNKRMKWESKANSTREKLISYKVSGSESPLLN